VKLNILVGGAKIRQWKIRKKEVEQIIARCLAVIGRDSLRREDFFMYFIGPNSPLFRICHDELIGVTKTSFNL
jgi:hypothetical protein